MADDLHLLMSIAQRHPILLQAFWTPITAVVAALTVHLLNRSRDHNIWVRDSTIKEWQELLSEVANAYMAIITEEPLHLDPFIAQFAGQKEPSFLSIVDTTLTTRIFIDSEVTRLNLRKRWAVIVDEYRKTKQKPAFKDGFIEIRTAIVEAAKRTR